MPIQVPVSSLMANAGTRLEPLRSESTSVTLIKDYRVRPGQGHFERVAMPNRVENAKVQRLLSYHGSYLLTTVLLWCLSFAIASPATAFPETLEMAESPWGRSVWSRYKLVRMMRRP